MTLTPKQLGNEERRDTMRSEDLNWRTTTRSEDVAWRQALREEDTDWRITTRDDDLAWRGEETRRSDRRYALLAAAQSVEPGSKVKDVLELAAHYAAWIESPDSAVTE